MVAESYQIERTTMRERDELHELGDRLNGLQSRIERMIYLDLGFPPVLPGSIADEEAAMDAACEAVEAWAEAKEEQPDLVPVTPLQHLLDEYVEAQWRLWALRADGIGR